MLPETSPLPDSCLADGVRAIPNDGSLAWPWMRLKMCPPGCLNSDAQISHVCWCLFPTETRKSKEKAIGHQEGVKKASPRSFKNCRRFIYPWLCLLLGMPNHVSTQLGRLFSRRKERREKGAWVEEQLLLILMLSPGDWGLCLRAWRVDSSCVLGAQLD